MILGFGSLGPLEIGLIFLAILLLFGAKRIPDIARALGKASREFKKAKDDIVDSAKDLADAAEKKAEDEDSDKSDDKKTEFVMDTDGSASMSLLDHLEEFRMVIFKILICLIILILPALYFAQDVVDLLIRYGCPDGVTLKYFTPLEPLWVRIRTAVVVAVIVAVPYIAWQMWGFIAPGLYRNEKMFLSRLAVASWILFLAGGCFGFKYIVPLVMKFSLAMGSDRMEPMIGIEAFTGMAGMTFIGFGVMAQCPVIVYLLIKTGIVEAATLKRQRPVVIIIILVISAFLTPPDVVSQLIMGVPAYLLFEASLFLAAIGVKKNSVEEAEEVFFSADKETVENVVVEKLPPTVDDCDSSSEPESDSPYPELRPSRRKLRYSGSGRRRRK